MTKSVEFYNARNSVFMHPGIPGGIPAGGSYTLVMDDHEYDDNQVSYDALPEMGIGHAVDGTPASGLVVVTGAATLTDERVVAVEATAPFTVTLEDAATAGDGFKLSIAVVSSQGIAATGTLTLSANVSDSETVTIGTKTYTFQSALTDVDGNVLIGASASDSIDNLIAAINLDAGAGSTYAASTTEHPTVTAAAGAGDTMDVTAKTAGTAGNDIATTETSATASWGDTTLTGGDNAGDITVAAAGADTVLGGASTTLADEGDVLQLVVDGTNWKAA